MKYEIAAVVGAGFSGAVVARKLADAGWHVEVFDERDHIGGNCYMERDAETDIMTHVYGPHIFHTDNVEVWNFVNQYDEFLPFTNRVKALAAGRIYTLPINLLTINSYFGKTFSPNEAKEFIAGLGQHDIENPSSFEEQALRYIGVELYEAFFKGYTMKQWGRSPKDLPASILKRLPVRFNYDDNYYNSKFQGMPRNGYTHIFEGLLRHENITLHIGEKFERSRAKDFQHTFYSGAIDAWFGFALGDLSYRTLDFENEVVDGDFQGNAVINYCDADVPFTRITEHKHFSPWKQQHHKSVISREFSREARRGDIPYYPVRLLSDKALLEAYVKMAQHEGVGVSFIGRLGTYRYLDMDVTIAEALDASEHFLQSHASHSEVPVFFVDPLR